MLPWWAFYGTLAVLASVKGHTYKGPFEEVVNIPFVSEKENQYPLPFLEEPLSTTSEGETLPIEVTQYPSLQEATYHDDYYDYDSLVSDTHLVESEDIVNLSDKNETREIVGAAVKQILDNDLMTTADHSRSRVKVVVQLKVSFVGAEMARMDKTLLTGTGRQLVVIAHIKTCWNSTMDGCRLERCLLKLRYKDNLEDPAAVEGQQEEAIEPNLGNGAPGKRLIFQKVEKQCRLEVRHCFECSGLDSCQAKISMHSGANGGDEAKGRPNDLSTCNVIPVDLKEDESPSCAVSRTSVAGEHGIVWMGCAIRSDGIAVVEGSRPAEDEPFSNPKLRPLSIMAPDFSHFKPWPQGSNGFPGWQCWTDRNEYETVCSCNPLDHDKCNRQPPNPPADRFKTGTADSIDKSIRQLRIDLKRTISDEIKAITAMLAQHNKGCIPPPS